MVYHVLYHVIYHVSIPRSIPRNMPANVSALCLLMQYMRPHPNLLLLLPAAAAAAAAACCCCCCCCCCRCRRCCRRPPCSPALLPPYCPYPSLAYTVAIYRRFLLNTKTKKLAVPLDKVGFCCCPR